MGAAANGSRRWRHVLVLVWLPLALALGCHRTAPYEGKSCQELQAMLHNADPDVQVQGAFGLSQLGAEAKPAVPDLAEALGSASALVRQTAALALGQIGPEARAAVPQLTASLHDPEWSVRRQAAIALGQIGPEARSAKAALEKLTEENNRLVSAAAKEALDRIDARRKQ